MTSNHKGIYYRSELGRQKRWCARIMVNGKYHNIGNFMKEEEAVLAYKNFIEENKDTLTNRAKNITKYQPDFPRDENGFTHRTCILCGKIDKFKRIPTSDMCKSCGIKESFKHRPAVGLKELDLELAYKDYQSGTSLEETGKKYGFSAGGLERKFKKHGYQTRDYREAYPITQEKYGNFQKGIDKIKEMCKTGEFQKRKSAFLQGIPVEEWTHFITPENKKFYASPEYKELKKKILQRDNYVCRWCGDKPERLELHHIKRKGIYPDLKHDTSNLLMLCFPCHNKTKGHEEELEQFFLDLLKSKGLPLQNSV